MIDITIWSITEDHYCEQPLSETTMCIEQFIAINDKLEADARVFISNTENGEESKIAERQKERDSV
jgi:hypothetical protein